MLHSALHTAMHHRSMNHTAKSQNCLDLLKYRISLQTPHSQHKINAARVETKASQA